MSKKDEIKEILRKLERSHYKLTKEITMLHKGMDRDYETFSEIRRRMENMLEVETSNDQNVRGLLEAARDVGDRGMISVAQLTADLNAIVQDGEQFKINFQPTRLHLKDAAQILSYDPTNISARETYRNYLTKADYNRLLYMKVKFDRLARVYIRYHASCIEQWTKVLAAAFLVEPQEVAKRLHVERLQRDGLPPAPITHIHFEENIFAGGPKINSAPSPSYPTEHTLIRYNASTPGLQSPASYYPSSGSGLDASAALGKPGQLRPQEYPNNVQYLHSP